MEKYTYYHYPYLDYISIYNGKTCEKITEESKKKMDEMIQNLAYHYNISTFFEPKGGIRERYGSNELKTKRIFNEVDPYGEENWED